MRRFAAYVFTRVATDIANSMVSELNSVLLPLNGGRPTTAVFKCDLSMFTLDLSLGKWYLTSSIQLISFTRISRETLRFSGNRIYCFPWAE